MPRLPTPSSDGGWQSDASTIDLELPLPSKSFMKKTGLGLSKGFRRRVKTPPPPPLSPRLLPPISLLTPYAPSIIPTLNPPPIFCCDHAKKQYPSNRFPDLCHIYSESITPLINNFIHFGREMAYGRLYDTTDKVVPENRYMVVIQQVEKVGARDMGSLRYFVPVVWEGEDRGGEDEEDQDQDQEMTDGEGETSGTGGGIGSGNSEPFTAPPSIAHHTYLTSHALTRSLIDLEDTLDEERLASSPRTQALTPVFARTYPWSDNPVEKRKEDRKVEWEKGQLGFREWFVTERFGTEGNMGLLWDWLPVEGRRGRMDVKCWECEREWVVLVRERGVTI